MKVEIWNKEGAVLLTRDGGESLKISLPEFWEIVRAGDRLDTREEIENYLADCDTIAGVSTDVIRGNAGFMDELVEKVIEKRVGNENGDQIYDAICILVNDGRNMDKLLAKKSLEDMDVEDFKDPGIRREFNGLMHAYRDLTRRMHEQNGMPFGGDRNMQDSLKLRLRNVTCEMDLLRVKEWLSQQPYDLDTETPQYQEALDMMEEICGWVFPELAGMVFDGEGNDLIFQEPHDSGLYVWAYYNPDANAGGQIVENSFGAADAARIGSAAVPAEVFDANHVFHSDINRKEFFMTIFDMLKLKEDGHYLGDNIQDFCRGIVEEKLGISRDDMKQRIFESFQEGRSTYELSGWDRGNVVVYCDCDLFTDRKVHFTTEESKFFYDMEQEGQGPAHEHIAEKLAGYVMSGELQLSEEGTLSPPQEYTWHGEVDVPYGFPGLDEIDYDSMELAAEGLLEKRFGAIPAFQDLSVERVGYYKGGVGYSFSLTTQLTADKAGSLIQKALDGLRFEACSDVRAHAQVENLIADAESRVEQCPVAAAGKEDMVK